jgi:hypothetical protein
MKLRAGYTRTVLATVQFRKSYLFKNVNIKICESSILCSFIREWDLVSVTGGGHRLEGFGNRALRRMSGPKTDEC